MNDCVVAGDPVSEMAINIRGPAEMGMYRLYVKMLYSFKRRSLSHLVSLTIRSLLDTTFDLCCITGVCVQMTITNVTVPLTDCILLFRC